MRTLCTLSDEKYLLQGLTMFESLVNYDIILYYLCLDKTSFDFIKKINNPKLIPFDVEILLNEDKTLYNLKNNDYRYFCYSLAPYFSNYLLKKENIDSITYIDSDIYFHKNISLIFDEIGDREVAIFKHRQFSFEQNRPEGAFNVGVVYFKNGEIGKYISDWWCDAVIHKKYPQYATCGDQKYLDAFVKMCPDDLLFIDGDIGHGAPWHWQLYDYSKFIDEGKIIYNNQEQLLIFTHFSQFGFEDKKYIPSKMHHIYTPLNMYAEIKELKMIYDDYYNKMKNVKEKYYEK